MTGGLSELFFELFERDFDLFVDGGLIGPFDGDGDDVGNTVWLSLVGVVIGLRILVVVVAVNVVSFVKRFV